MHAIALGLILASAALAVADGANPWTPACGASEAEGVVRLTLVDGRGPGGVVRTLLMTSAGRPFALLAWSGDGLLLVAYRLEAVSVDLRDVETRAEAERARYRDDRRGHDN
jgi:hypothetical protein